MKLCPRCIASWFMNHAVRPWIDWGDDAGEGAWRIEDELDGRWSPAKPLPGPGLLLIEVLDLALERGHPVFDACGMRIEMLTTWQGDPICTYHLIQLYQAEISQLAQPGRQLWRR